MPIVAPPRLESRKSLLGNDPGFSSYNAQYDQPASYGGPDLYDQTGPAYGQSPYAQPSLAEPTYTEPAYTEPSYAQNNQLNTGYNQGYAHREGLAPAAPAPSTVGSRMDFLRNKWSAAFMAVASVQAVVCLAFES